MFGLDVDSLRGIRKAMDEVKPIAKAIIYGSRANGNYKNGSDIDLVLLGKKITFKNSVYPLVKRLDKLYLPYKFDISILKTIRDLNIVEEILERGKAFYQRENISPWPMVKLGEVCTQDRKSIDGKNKKARELPYIGLEDIEKNTGKINIRPDANNLGKSNCYLFDNRHILYGKLRPYLNKVAMPDFMGRCTTEAIPFLLQDNMARKFVVLFLRTNKVVEWSMGKTTGTRMPRADIKRLLEFKIPLPPLKTQKEIVAVLDGTFSGIDMAVANTEKNLKSCKEIFDSCLNKILANDNGKWPMVKLGEVSGKFKYPSKIEKTEYLDVGLYPIISQEKELISGHSNDSNYLIKDHPVVIFGDHTKCIKYIDFDFCLGADGAKVLLPPKEMNARFFYYAIKNVPLENLGYARHFKILKKKSIPLPPLKTQKEIVAKIDKVKEQTNRLEELYSKKLKGLKDLKKAVLELALKGELTE